ncbi:hypothetical protein TRICI_006312 [Trichomonascus ciferrii]|uniref:Uncharacterized protein n=1 Tax=Trichomonascus ciferrii TaxID=44093 RepID=A0A642UIP6_9ASCO|nr:hypothetical protein TRICI_006312 [Trichomonascus ciferrii]
MQDLRKKPHRATPLLPSPFTLGVEAWTSPTDLTVTPSDVIQKAHFCPTKTKLLSSRNLPRPEPGPSKLALKKTITLQLLGVTLREADSDGLGAPQKHDYCTCPSRFWKVENEPI